MKYLVTGGAGFIGSHITDRLIEEGHKVCVIDNLSSGKKSNLNKKAEFFQANIRNPKISDIFKKEKFDFVFHFAAHIEARESVKSPIFDARENILGSLNILCNCRKFNVKKVIFSSSGGEVYGQVKSIPTSEEYFPRPISPYGVSKLSVEKYLDAYYQFAGLSYAILRYGNVYGPRQNPSGEAGVVAIFIDKMLKNRQPLIHGDGKQTKDYIFIEDIVEATLLSFQKNFIGILNVGTGRETSVLDIFSKIKDLTCFQGKREHISSAPCSFKRSCLSIKKIKKKFNWQPKYGINKGLEKTVEWFKEKSNYEK